MFLVKIIKITNNRVEKLIFPENCFGTVMTPANFSERTSSLSRFMLVLFSFPLFAEGMTAQYVCTEVQRLVISSRIC